MVKYAIEGHPDSHGGPGVPLPVVVAVIDRPDGSQDIISAQRGSFPGPEKQFDTVADAEALARKMMGDQRIRETTGDSKIVFSSASVEKTIDNSDLRAKAEAERLARDR